jgi:hypothetical protein
MSDFLTLSQDLHREVGAAGVEPSAVTNQAGENKRLVAWVKQADYKIQNKWINWKFLRTEFITANQTAAGVNSLAKPADLKTWDLKTFKIIYPGQTEENEIPGIEYEDLKGWVFGTSNGPPGLVIVMPDNSLKFDVPPDGIYTILADYYKKPVKLVANTDVSLIPEEYHESAVLGQAMMYYANFESAPEIKQQGMELYEEGMLEMENHQLPNRNYSRARTGGGFEVMSGSGLDDFDSFSY